MSNSRTHSSFLEPIGLLLIFFYLFGLASNRDYEEVTARTVSCSHFHGGRLLSASECFDYARKHKNKPYLMTIRERIFHVSFVNQTVAEVVNSGETKAYSCKVFDSENWTCPIGLNASQYDQDWANESSRIVMKDGRFEEWLNAAIEPKNDIHLSERTTLYLGNWLEYKFLQFCTLFNKNCKPSYNIDAEDDLWF